MADRSRADRVAQVFNRLFVRWFRFRKGRVRFRGAPTLILHTVGARTAQPRQTPLLYLDVGDGTYAVVGSNGGDDRTPAWVHNLRKHPDVAIEVDGSRREVTAGIADSDTRQQLWPRLVGMYKSYDDYQRKTKREIPVIVLTPGSASS